MAKKKRGRRKKKPVAAVSPPEKKILAEEKKKHDSKLKNQKKIIFTIIPICIILAVAYFVFLLPKSKIHVNREDDLNILLVTLDTTRADRIGVYGHEEAKTPNLDYLASHGVRFSNAYCQVPLTLPSHVSLLTGTFPIYHHVHNNGFYYLSPDHLTLAEILKENGFKTAAFVSSFTVDSRFGLDQGFDFYEDTFSDDELMKNFRSERIAEKVFEPFSQWLDKNYTDKFFCWVHFFDPHLPYEPPSPYKEEFSNRLYDGEIAYMDYYIGKTIEKLKERNVLNKTLIILAGDHGEALGEKGEIDHGLFLYEPTMRVPLIFFAENNLPKEMIIDSCVRLVDIMPSVLEMVKIPIPDNIQGESLISFITGKKKKGLSSYIETVYPRENYGWSELIGLIDGKWKYIKAPKAELYNIKEDPVEETNLINRETKVVQSMNENLDAMIKHYSSEIEAVKKDLTLEEQARLRSLGYLGGGDSSRTSGKSLPDPKDKISEFQSFVKAKTYEMEGKFQEAAEVFENLLGMNPDFDWNYVHLSLIYTKLERLDDSIRLLEMGLERIPDSMVILSRLVHFYMRAEKFDKAFETSQRALQIDPRFLNGLIISGMVKNMQGNWTEAVEYFKRALEIEPENKIIQMRYAYSLGAMGKTNEAIEIYNRLKEDNPNDFQVYSDLGIIYNAIGDYAKAVENLKKAVELGPSPETYLKYAAILERTGNLEEAVRYLRLYLETTPEKDTPQKTSAQRTLSEWERRIKK